MTNPNGSWRSRLIGRFPVLFDPHPGFPSCGDGWERLLTTMCERVGEAAKNCRSGSLRIAEIRQKLGGLRVCFEATSIPDDVMDKVGEAVELAEARAASTCERCGADGRLHDNRGFLQTLCRDHASGDVVEERPHHRGLHIRWRMIDGRMHVVSCRRYDRGTDTFVHVPLPDDIEV